MSELEADQERGSPKPQKRLPKRRPSAPIIITDDWPEMVPITQQEVRIIEAYLGKVLDELLGPLP
jgi:uncharacterized protein YqeY